jgi:hypothetical protein
VDVILTAGELGQGSLWAWEAWQESKSLGFRQRHGYQSHGGARLDVEVLGLWGEMAVRKILGLPQERHLHVGDEGDAHREEVRTTWRSNGSLILRPADPPARVFWLVVAEPPRFRLAGTILAKEGMAERFWDDGRGRPGWWRVPQSALQPACFRVVELTFSPQKQP